MTEKAFLFDLNGTMIDDMAYHTQAWYDILNNELKANLSWEQIKTEMYGKNQELLVRVFGAEKFSIEQMDTLSLEKERRYQTAFKPHLQLINGLQEFITKAHNAGIRMAIGSAAIAYNVDFVLDGLNLRKYISSIVCADDVQISKPHPETFLKAAEKLGVAPADCIVFEDAPKGVEAAANAGMKSVVVTTMHDKEEFNSYDNVLMFVSDYTDPRLLALV